MADVPVEEDTLMWLLLMGLGYDHRLGANEAVDLADQLIRRAAMLAANGQCLSCILFIYCIYVLIRWLLPLLA